MCRSSSSDVIPPGPFGSKKPCYLCESTGMAVLFTTMNHKWVTGRALYGKVNEQYMIIFKLGHNAYSHVFDVCDVECVTADTLQHCREVLRL